MTKTKIDWECVEREYRAGIKSLKQIGAEYGVSDAGILKRAKRDGWERDLSAKIKARADAKVSAAVVSAEVSAQTKVAEREVVEANAQMQADAILAHRADIRRNREIARALLAELEAQTGSRELFDRLTEILAGEGENTNDKMLETYRKVISLPSRVDSMKKLADTLKVLIGLEREAFGIDSKKTAGQTLDEFLDGLAAEG